MGGAQYQMKHLVDSLVETGNYDIFYLARRVKSGFSPDGYEIVKIGDNPNQPRWGYVADSRLVLRELKRIRPDVIYQRIGCGYTGIAAFYAKRYDARMVWHICSETDVTRRNLKGGRNWLRLFLEKRALAYGIQNTTSIVAQTHAQGVRLKREYGRTVDLVIPNFQPKPREHIEKDVNFTVIWIGNFKRTKNPDSFIRLAAACSDRPGIRFLMIGSPATHSNEQAWMESLKTKIDSIDNLSYLGLLSQKQVNQLLAKSHVLVNTSDFEGFPNTFIQAWMRRVPVVSLNVDPDGVLEREGIGIHAGSEPRLIEVIKELTYDIDKLERSAARAEAHAIETYSLRNINHLERLLFEC